MRARDFLVASLSLSSILGACVFGQSEESDDQASAESAATIAACTAGARPSVGFGTAPALGEQTFVQPIEMVPIPSEGSTFYVAERKGVIKRASTSGTSTVFADLRTKINSSAGEAGLLGIALHPKFAQNGLVFLAYTSPSSTAAANQAQVIARGKSNDGGRTLDLSSVVELIRFDDPYWNHNGGKVAFGPDGFLYAAFGDGGSGGDPQNNGQNKNSLFGKIIRIDVDRGNPYAIPADNPFASGGGKPEIYAYGLRNTWRFSFDREGGNYGWNKQEGKHCYSGASCVVAGAIPPVVEYDHSQGYSVTGGFVYRGSAIPELRGQYLYGDYGSGKVWAIPANEAAPTPKVIFNSASLSSFAEDNAGELYVLDYSAGKVKKIVATATSGATLPQKLSQTGCFVAGNPQVPTDKLIPFEVNSPLWSDNAEKNRWLAVPAGQKIRVLADGDWDLPNGSVLVKEFRLGGKRIETRLFVRHTDGSWAGYTYEWNDAQTDATLLPDGKTKVIAGQPWTYPSRSQCMGCHNASAGFSLGLETAQLNRVVAYAGEGRQNQLERFADLGLFAAPLPANPPALPTPTSTAATDAERARSYLHANCAFCHRPEGPGRGDQDLRFSRTFAQTKLCNVTPQSGDLGIAGAKLVVPGDSSKSLLSVRMHRTDDKRMPPVGSAIVDGKGSSIIDGWIESLDGCN
jgi:uncharacterized repeat protein (TIGR03806 family)